MQFFLRVASTFLLRLHPQESRARGLRPLLEPLAVPTLLFFSSAGLAASASSLLTPSHAGGPKLRFWISSIVFRTLRYLLWIHDVLRDRCNLSKHLKET